MSLINDALKKAQNMQSGGGAAGSKIALRAHPKPPPVKPAPVAPPSPPVPVEVKPRKSGIPPGLILVVAGVVFVGAFALVIIAGVIFWNKASTSSDSPNLTAAFHAAEKAAAETSQELAAVTAEFERPEPVPVAAAPAPAPAAVPPMPAAPTQDAPAIANPSVVATDVPLPAPIDSRRRAPTGPDPRIHAYVLGIKVAGIRTGENPKALMNDRVYSIGEFVSTEFDLRLAEVEDRRLALEDSSGNRYEIRF